MPPSRVIRIDGQVWAELQQRARPLEDTPNSVLRRVFELPEAASEPGGLDPRVAALLHRVQQLVGAAPQVQPVEKGYSLLSRTGEGVAYIRPQRDRLRVGASKELARKAGLDTWDRERADRFFGGPSVRWYAQDGDDAGYQRLCAVLEKLWRAEP